VFRKQTHTLRHRVVVATINRRGRCALFGFVLTAELAYMFGQLRAVKPLGVAARTKTAWATQRIRALLKSMPSSKEDNQTAL
jgi:hypothetical protein